MSITAIRNIKQVNITATRNGTSVLLQPVISKSTSGCKEYENLTDTANGRLRRIIIPADFDFTSIPDNYDNAIWDIRYVHDLNGADSTLPSNVTLDFHTGRIINYGDITLDETKINYYTTYPIFDGSGTFINYPKIVPNYITPIHFGAVGDDTTDSTNAFQKVSEFIGASQVTFTEGRPTYANPLQIQSAEIYVPSGMYRISETITLRAGQVWIGNMATTILRFNPTTAGDNLIEITNSVLTDNYFSTRQRHIWFNGFTLSGDIAFDGTGNASSAIYMIDASFCNISNLIINKFEYAINVNLGSVAAYYNKFSNIDAQQNRQNVHVGQGTAVTCFEKCLFVGRGEFTGKYDFNVVAYRDAYFNDCSFEGSTWPVGHIDSPEGGVYVDGRQEGAPIARVNGRAVTGTTTFNFSSGNTNGYGEVTNIDDAPLLADMGDDQTVLGQDFSFSQGIAQELKMLKNQDFKFGVADWSFDGDLSANGSYKLLEDRADIFGAETAIQLTKINGSGVYSIFQTLKLNTPQFYMTVWARSSSDAVIRFEMSNLYARDNSITTNFKDYNKVLTVGDWSLYVVKVSHYYKNKPTLDPRPYLGLKNNSPVGSWVVFSNLRFWAGSYPVFSGSDESQVNKNFILSEKPTEGFVNFGDRIDYDGTNSNYPITGTSPTGVLCTFKLESTAFADRSSGSSNIIPTPNTGILAGDIMGIYLDNGNIQWNVVTNFLFGLATLKDTLDDDVTTGNRIITYRLTDQYSKTPPLKPYLVSELPTGSEGDTAYVTDASSISYRASVTGGGTDKALVFKTSSGWVYH